MAVVTKLVGLAEAKARFISAGQDLLGKAARALYTEAELVKTRSMEDTPVETGALRASHRVEKPVLGSEGISVTIRVGGPTPGYMPVNYAIYVHEMTWLNHKVGKAKFLEDQVNAAQEGLAARIAARMG